MLVLAQNGQGVLAAERRDPRVIGGDRRTSLFELNAHLRVPNGGFLIDLEHARDGDELLQPALVLTPVSRLSNSETVLAGGGAVFPPASSSSFRVPGTCLQASRPLPRSQIGEAGLFVPQPSPWRGGRPYLEFPMSFSLFDDPIFMGADQAACLAPA